MKWLSYIVSIYVFCLLAFPCQDDCILSASTETEHSTSHDDKDCNSCSPFCFCNCCHVNTIVTFNAVLTNAVIIPTFFEIIYKESFIKEIIFSIWQPPKI
jgi:hypothetical protein